MAGVLAGHTIGAKIARYASPMHADRRIIFTEISFFFLNLILQAYSVNKETDIDSFLYCNLHTGGTWTQG
jgi:hypothetical protein